MPTLWDYLPRSTINRRNSNHNLQDGLFQIATHTCSLLVQVNNTNNISFGNNSTNIQCTSFRSKISSSSSCSSSSSSTTPRACDQDQLVVLLPPKNGKSALSTLGKYKHRLSTVLEGGGTEAEDLDLWNQGYMLRDEFEDERVTRWNSQNWCKPSCIPITIILILIFLVVLLPLVDHAMVEDNTFLNREMQKLYRTCPQSCRMSLVESIPEGLTYPNNSIIFPTTHETWIKLINFAEETIEIGSFYWTLRKSEEWPDPSSEKGEEVFQALLDAGTTRGIKIKIAQNAPTIAKPNTDTEYLEKRKAAEVRSLNFAQILGDGVLHTKVWIIDRKHFYVGSANMDWRALTQVKELGAVFYDCSCLAEDIAKIFEVYWMLGENPVIPKEWPKNLSTIYNIEQPMNLSINNYSLQTYISSSPPPFCPDGRSTDLEAVLNVISNAEKFVYVSVMDYFPLTIYTPKLHYWPAIDNALRTAAIDQKVHVKLLISQWNHSRESEDYFLRSLADLSNSYPGVNIEIKRFKVPGTEEQNKIPFARVNHNKYMVTDNTAYIGTSNWSGDYFISTAGIGLIIHDPDLSRNLTEPTVRGSLQAIFERDWNSAYASSL